MKLRRLTGEELLVLHCLWGPAMWNALTGLKVVDDFFQSEHKDWLVFEYDYAEPAEPLSFGRSAYVCDDRSPTSFIFCPAAAGVASLAHEVGHAVCDRLYPESRQWPVEKCEAFALLADVNAGKWNEDRASFAQHFRASRRHPGYERPLRWAFSLRTMPLKDQMAAIATS